MPKYKPMMENKIKDLIERGFRNSEISRRLNIYRGAVAKRRKEYEKRKQDEEKPETEQESLTPTRIRLPQKTLLAQLPTQPEYVTGEELKSLRELAPKPTIKGSRFIIDPVLTGRFRGVNRSPLDAELESEDAMLARDLKVMRVDEIVLKRRSRIAKLQRELDDLEKDKEKNEKVEPAMPGISIAMARQISMLPLEEQEKIMQTYAAFRSIDRSKGSGNALLPLLVGFSKSNPGTSQSDMVAYAKAMADQFNTGIEAMKAVMPKEEPSNSIELLTIFKDLVTDSVKKPMEELVRNFQHQPSAFEQILMNPEMFSRAKEVGMFGHHDTEAEGRNIDLEIEKLRGERELSMKKMDLEWKRDMLKRDSEDRRTDSVLSILAPFSALAAGPLNQRMRQFGQQQAAAHNPTSIMQPSEKRTRKPEETDTETKS